MAQIAWIGMVVFASALTACSPKPSADQQAREDARAVAMVEAAQKVHPPPVSLTPQPWSEADVASHRLPGSSCRMAERPSAPDPSAAPVAGRAQGQAQRREAVAAGPVLVASPQRALIKVDGRFMMFAADVGSARVVPGMLRHYVGKSHALTVERGAGERGAGDGTALGAEQLSWPATLTIRDAWDQIVYTAPAILTCAP